MEQIHPTLEGLMEILDHLMEVLLGRQDPTLGHIMERVDLLLESTFRKTSSLEIMKYFS